MSARSMLRYNCFPVLGAVRDFGNYITGNISGYKRDESGNLLAGWNITLKSETRAFYAYNVTNASGYYSIGDVPFGEYWLNETISEWLSWIPVIGNRTVEINQTNLVLINQNFTNNQVNGSLSGYKFNETLVGQSDWTIELYNETSGVLVNTTTPGSGGYYVFENINDWGYYNITEVQQTGWNLLTPGSGWYSHIYVNGILMR